MAPRTISAAPFLALLAGCVSVGRYDAAAFPAFRVAQDRKVEACAVVEMPEEDRAHVSAQRVPGTYRTLRVPLGAIVQEAAERVLRDVFVGPPGGGPAGSCPAIVSPKVTSFQVDSSHRASLMVRVILRDRQGAVLLDKEYDSGPFTLSGPAANTFFVTPESRRESNVAWGAHAAAQRVMLRAAADVRTRFLREDARSREARPAGPDAAPALGPPLAAPPGP